MGLLKSIQQKLKHAQKERADANKAYQAAKKEESLRLQQERMVSKLYKRKEILEKAKKAGIQSAQPKSEKIKRILGNAGKTGLTASIALLKEASKHIEYTPTRTTRKRKKKRR